MYRLYVDKNGILRMVMDDSLPKGLVRGINVSDMSIDGLCVTQELTAFFTGMYGLDDKRNKVLWVD